MLFGLAGRSSQHRESGFKSLALRFQAGDLRLDLGVQIRLILQVHGEFRKALQYLGEPLLDSPGVLKQLFLLVLGEQLSRFYGLVFPYFPSLAAGTAVQHKRMRAFSVWVLPLLAAGCVQRSLRIESTPPGAEAWLDGEPVGTTPVEVPFLWYGEREVLLQKEGFRSVRSLASLSPPWWQVFPFDFVTEVLLPVPLRDEHVVHKTLEPEVAAPVALEEMRSRAEEYRRKSQEP